MSGRRKRSALSPEEKAQLSLETERRIRAAAEGEQWPRVPGDWWPRPADLEALFLASPATVHRWLDKGVEMASGRRMLIRYTVAPGGIREARPTDVLAVLEETRKLRSADHPGGIGDADTPGL